ncbi:odorant receptor 13a isoform X1 [Solenopsis invicta]|uniref:odorant receptor 13a isoform X1 n=1 Tax=Solenopsis invicta TaxID=13686 RepID=UPI00193CB4B4|nr:odorant receptor 13a isoform X1 [Solenopsis invicta]
MTITNTVSPALKFGLQLLGLWPGVSYSIIYWSSFMLSMIVMQYFQYLYILNHIKVSELLNLVDSIPLALDYGLTIFKLISLWLHRRVLHEILTAMDNDWRECINVDRQLYVMQMKANISHICCNAILSFNAIATLLYFVGDYIVHIMFLSKDYNDTLRRLPLKAQLPYETQQSPLFEIVFAMLLLHVFLHASAVGIINGLIFTLVLHVGGQIDIICQKFKNTSENTLFSKTSVPSFGMLIERHNRIISASDNIEKLFSFIALMQVLWNTLVICSLGFAFTFFIHNGANVFGLVKSIFGYFGVTIEAFVICFAGEYLSHKGKLIANASYEMMWYDMPSKQSKIIIFIIMRSQKRLTITAGKMTDMSFGAFTSVSFQIFIILLKDIQLYI